MFERSVNSYKRSKEIGLYVNYAYTKAIVTKQCLNTIEKTQTNEQKRYLRDKPTQLWAYNLKTTTQIRGKMIAILVNGARKLLLLYGKKIKLDSSALHGIVKI